MSATGWTPEEQATLARMASEGARAAEIAEALGYTRNAVLGRAHRTGVRLTYRVPPAKEKPARPRQARRSKYLPAEKDRVRELYLAGAPWDDIEALTGIPKPTGYLWTLDLPRRFSRPTNARYDFNQRVMAVAAHLCGKSFDKVSAALGPTPATLQKWQNYPEVFAAARVVADRVLSDMEAERARLRELAAFAAEAERIRVETVNEPVFAQMSARHREMCRRRVDGETLEAIAKDFGITRERVRQIEGKWRCRGLIIPGARPLSEASARNFAPSSNPRPRGRPAKRPAREPRSRDDFYALAHEMLEAKVDRRRREFMSPETRAKKVELGKRVAAIRWAGAEARA